MDRMLENLKKYGADIDGTMGRFLGDVDLYKTCFATFLADEAFEKLGEALEAMDDAKAFEYAHTLKGITGNMGLTPLYQLICNIVEDLRRHENSSVKGYYTDVVAQLDMLKKFQE